MKDSGNPVSDEASRILKRAYALNGAEDAQQLYRDWASTYDEHLEQELGYIAPALIATMLADALKDREAPVLDVGCGTGLVGEYLTSQGFSAIDGLDFSPEMLAQAERKSCYRQLVEANLNAVLDIPSQTYEGAISCGTFTHGHVQANALDEIIRVLKPSSYLACTVHCEIWHSAGFESKISSLIEDQVIVVSRKHQAPYYEGSHADGNYCLIHRL